MVLRDANLDIMSVNGRVDAWVTESTCCGMLQQQINAYLLKVGSNESDDP